jgi:hypothetical protein
MARRSRVSAGNGGCPEPAATTTAPQTRPLRRTGTPAAMPMPSSPAGSAVTLLIWV